METRKNPGFRQRQAAGKTVPIIRIAVTGMREKCVMTVLLAETAPGIKRLLRLKLKQPPFAICAICAYVLRQMAQR